MADLKQNTWELDQWYAQDVAGNVPYTGAPALFGMGWNSKGQLGLNQNSDSDPGGAYSSPVQLPGTTWEFISCFTAGDANHTLATKTDGTLWAFGYNNDGQLGQNDGTYRSSPVQIPGTSWATANLRLGQYQSATIKTDGTLWSWGFNSPSYGELGHNNKTTYSSPKQVGTETTWDKLTTSQYAFMATKTDGTLWSWGGNQWGKLGHNNTTNYSSPKQVGTSTDWDQITGGSQFSAATKTDGTLWTWGVNEYGMLAMGNKTNYSSPRQVGTENTWSKISCTNASMVAIKTDGTLWTWGFGGEGRLGLNQGEPSQYSSPVQIGTGTDWGNVINQTPYSGVATKTDGTLWVWGYNSFGNLGVNDVANRSSPIQIPGNWNTADGKLGSNYIGLWAIANQ